MLTQATAGQIDVITGDYLAGKTKGFQDLAGKGTVLIKPSEVNLAVYAEAFSAGEHPGYLPTALDGLTKSLDAIHTNGIKVIINGGALNPKGLAFVTHAMVCQTNWE